MKPAKPFFSKTDQAGFSIVVVVTSIFRLHFLLFFLLHCSVILSVVLVHSITSWSV